ncbi:hypothetical protein V8E54_009921 [Elaphomyces granulatus]
MEGGDLVPLLEQLESNVDDLQKVLQPLLQGSLCISLISDMSRKLPLLDRAKLLMLITYTLESLLFSYLRLHGVDSREHLVYKELTCIKQYFEKIKALETSPEKRAMALDKKAADPSIKHGLVGVPRSDLERAEKEAKEKALAQLRAMKLAKKSAVSQQASAKERSSHSTNSGSRPASQSDSHSNRHGSAEGGVPVAKAPATTAQQPSVKKTAKEKSRGRRERYKAAKAMKSPQTQIGKKGDGSELRKAKSSGKRRRLAAKAAAKDKNAKAS